MTEIDQLIRERRSVRAFLDRPVARDLVEEILEVARWSPSGSNMQPWQVTALSGPPLRDVSDLAQRSMMANQAGEAGEFPIYPPNLKEPYRSRRYETGELMYEQLGIARDNKVARLLWLAGNFRFFDAPVGLLFSIDRSLERAQWAHLGMFMQSVALVAQSRGLASCMQEAWGMVRDTVHAHLEMEDHMVIYAGMALGYADPDAPVNGLRTPREPVERFTDFRGFE